MKSAQVARANVVEGVQVSAFEIIFSIVLIDAS